MNSAFGKISLVFFLGLAVPAAFAADTPAAPVPSARPPRRGTSPGVPGAHLDYRPGQLPPFWSVATAETIMARYPDYREAYWKPWSYCHGYVFRGFEMLYRETGDKKYLDYIRRYIDHFVDEKGNFHGDNLDSLDNIMTGSAIVMLYEYTHDPRYQTAAAQFRHAFDDYPRNHDGGFWHGKRSTGQMWVDGIFMGQMFLTRYGRVFGDGEYCFNEATRQITIFAGHALKGDSGLYYHAWSERPDLTKWADPKTGLSPEVWSEGLGWYALIQVETLAVLPPDHPKRAELEDIFRRLAAGLKRTQDPVSGRWFQVVDKGGQPVNWTDTSGSSMFVYALERGIELGLLPEKEYAPVVARGFAGITARAHINEHGLVDIDDAGDGVTVKKDYATYIAVKRVTNAKECVGGFLWATALIEKPRLEEAAARRVSAAHSAAKN